MPTNRLLLTAYFLVSVAGKCFEPNPAFPVPQWKNSVSRLKPAFDALEIKLKEMVSQPRYDNSSYSVEVTSTTETIWSSYHTARNVNESRPGDTNIDGQSQYRIASLTKVFTVLAILYQANAGNLSLDDSVSKYVSELNSKDYELPWKDITIRVLASQLSGIPREFAQSDIYNYFPNPQALGLPYVPREDIHVHCDEYSDYSRPCTRKDLLDQLKYFQPVFAPNQKSTYSNLNFQLLGLVIENVTGLPYKDYIQTAIFDPLDMTLSSLERPESDEHAVLPLGPNSWDMERSVQAPTGGIYSSSSDLSKFLRYVLTHYNTLTTGVNWFLPSSWAEGMNSFYGMPWEIFRTDEILKESRRPVTFVGKGGSLEGYTTRMIILEDYGLAITILTAGSITLLDELLEAITVTLVNAAEEEVWSTLGTTHSGQYTSSSPSSNSSLTLAVSPTKGLHITSLVVNSTDIFTSLFSQLPAVVTDPSQPWYAQLVPTKLYEDEDNQSGEIWRFLIIADRPDVGGFGVWDEFCVTDVDQITYASVPFNKVVFWLEQGLVELSAFRLKLKREEHEIFAVQE